MSVTADLTIDDRVDHDDRRRESEAGGSLPLLRFTTCGSVDDGKSTLIGRLLYDTRSIPEDQLDAIRRVSAARGRSDPDLSLLTDGLRSEREQGITIDVAYRYFGTARRRFIVADAPGHAQYTRNMATAASVSDLAVILIDARHGITDQTRRHARITAMMRVPNVVVAINKIDLVTDAEATFAAIRQSVRALFASFPFTPESVTYLPISALRGDNVVRRGEWLGWYDGPTLLEVLETTRATPELTDQAQAPLRAQVQTIVRPVSTGADASRSYGIAVLSGEVRPGREVVVLPSGQATRVEAVTLGCERLARAGAPRAVTITLRDEVDISRGDVLSSRDDEPDVTSDFLSDVVWLGRSALRPGARLLAKHGTRSVRVVVDQVVHHAESSQDSAGEIRENEIGRVRIRAVAPFVFDPYTESRAMGAFILIDETTAGTVGGGMFVGPAEVRS
jgi:sulfate adenylyltransferase subunit 1